jgi:hypothetical protein
LKSKHHHPHPEPLSSNHNSWNILSPACIPQYYFPLSTALSTTCGSCDFSKRQYFIVFPFFKGYLIVDCLCTFHMRGRQRIISWPFLFSVCSESPSLLCPLGTGISSEHLGHLAVYFWPRATELSIIGCT